MIYDFNQTILTGGITHCTQQWDRKGHSPLDNCLKLYLPFDGKAQLSLTNTQISLLPGKIYLINGTKITSRCCSDYMDVGWVHFIPVSLRLKYILFKYFKYKKWDFSEIPVAKSLLKILGKSFEYDTHSTIPKEALLTTKTNQNHLDDASLCILHGIFLYLIGNTLQSENLQIDSQEYAAFQKLKPAIQFMDQNYKDNPPLNNIAAKVFMAPNSFQRLFKTSFNTSPFEYMLSKRLSLALQLLTATNLNIDMIARECGYENAFYFSRIFKKRFGIAPSNLRKNETMELG